MLKINILSIAGSGLLLVAAGFLLYCFRDFIGGRIRFFLTIPPVCVASYVFVFNMFKDYDGLILKKSIIFSELLTATIVSGVTFVLFTSVMVGFVLVLK